MINVLLVDDQRVIRDGLKAMLDTNPAIQIVGVAQDGQKAIEQVEALHPDVVLMDIHMPVMEGIPATQVITQQFPQTKVLILTTEEEDKLLADALQAGARGYLLKHSSAEEIVNAIQLIDAGHSQVGPGLLEKIVAKMSAPSQPFPPIPGQAQSTYTIPADLAPLELELTRLLNQFDADELTAFTQRSLVQNHRDWLMQRSHAHLEQAPQSLTALYLLGTWSREQHQQQALDYLRLGFKAGVQQQLGPQSLLLFCWEAAAIDRHEVFHWLDQAGPLWNEYDVCVSLLPELGRLFGIESVPYRLLLARWQARTLSTVSAQCITLQSTIEELQRGSRRLHKSCSLLKSPLETMTQAERTFG